jgi:hypothetical protein
MIDQVIELAGRQFAAQETAEDMRRIEQLIVLEQDGVVSGVVVTRVGQLAAKFQMGGKPTNIMQPGIAYHID